VDFGVVDCLCSLCLAADTEEAGLEKASYVGY